MIIVAVLATACVVLSPTLLRHVGAAYPSEPDKQRALELCSRVDPTFVRFLASERTTCYAHFRELVARTTADFGDTRPALVIAPATRRR